MKQFAILTFGITILYDLERQKREAEGMLYESEEQEVKTRELNEAIDKFETWAMGIGELLKDLAYVVDYDSKRLACQILGIKAQAWPVDAKKRYEITISPPSIMSLLCG